MKQVLDRVRNLNSKNDKVSSLSAIEIKELTKRGLNEDQYEGE